MTVLVTADLHLSAKSRDAYRFEAMGKIAKMLTKYKVDTLIILGDLTEEKDFHSAPLVNKVVDVIYDFSKLVDEVIIPRGNHDYTQIDCPFFGFLKRIPGVRWLNDVTRGEVGKADCLFLPHTRDYKKDWVKLPHLEEIDWIFAHNTFEGATTEHGKKLSGIPTDFFDDTTVFSGDVHTPQTLGPVTYVGAPYSVDFGDDYDPRVLLLTYYGPKDFKVESIPVPGPQKRLIDITTDDLEHISEGIGLGLSKGDIVKARIKLRPDEQDNWFAVRDSVKRELADLGVTVHLIQPVTTSRNRSLKLGKTAQAKSDVLVVQEFGKVAKVPAETLKVGLDFVREV